MKQELPVAAALIEDKNKYLLAQRKADDKYANLWEFPGGLIEDGESVFAAIEREIKEELSLTVRAKKLISTFSDESPTLKISVSLILCSIEDGQPQALDCQDFGFFTLNESKALNLAPVDRKIVNFLESQSKGLNSER